MNFCHIVSECMSFLVRKLLCFLTVILTLYSSTVLAACSKAQWGQAPLRPNNLT